METLLAVVLSSLRETAFRLGVRGSGPAAAGPGPAADSDLGRARAGLLVYGARACRPESQLGGPATTLGACRVAGIKRSIRQHTIRGKPGPVDYVGSQIYWPVRAGLGIYSSKCARLFSPQRFAWRSLSDVDIDDRCRSHSSECFYFASRHFRRCLQCRNLDSLIPVFIPNPQDRTGLEGAP
jgi:hypothetical protein